MSDPVMDAIFELRRVMIENMDEDITAVRVTITAKHFFYNVQRWPGDPNLKGEHITQP